MVKINFLQKGNTITVEVPEGTNVMEAAKFYADPPLQEIPATCGGACACGTCHVYLTDKWVDKIGNIDYDTPEAHLLEYENGYKEGVSRLGCQIEMNEELDGLTVILREDELL